MRTPFRLTPPGADLRGDYWSDAAPGEAAAPDEGAGAASGAAIVVCHGFKGFKDWGFFPHLCERLAEQTGIPVVSFNFDGSGVRDSDFDDLKAFSHNTFSRELWDLEAILDGLASGRLGDVEVSPATRFGLLGHSRGGATCILKAGLRSQVRGLVTWASISSVTRYESFADRWEAGETVIIPNARTKQDMPLERNVLDDMRANRERLDVLASAASLRIPVTVVHGTADESVPFSDAWRIADAVGDLARLVGVDGGTHTFQAGHPFAGATPELEEAIDASVELFTRALK
ncbi:alpha/beta hydrolase family protein [Candidatus Palauibacter sp.]|uniref:alpha/beta hydrolase family protein n=1 Tax=Candidatus Palauibacter sp. TaxID=3101350 RepID=UPI003D0F0F9D